MIAIAAYIIAFSVFFDSKTIPAETLTEVLGFTRGAEIYGYYPLFIGISILLAFSPKVKWNPRDRYLLGFFAVIFCSGLACYHAGYDLGDVLKQFTGILFSVFPAYLVVSHYRNNLLRLFRIYLNVAFIISCIGIFQEVSFLLRFQEGYNYSWILNKWWLAPLDSGLLLRINAVCSEPAHLAYALSPAVFAGLSTFLGRSKLMSKFTSAIIISAFLLTFSTMGYFGLVIMGLLFMRESGMMRGISRVRFALLAIALVPTIYVLASFAPGISERINDNIGVMLGTKDITAINPSAFALQSNLAVTREAFKNSPILGTGLGTHARNYDRFIGLAGGGRLTSFSDEGLNRADANSLFLRLLSETGLVGTIAFLSLVYANFSFFQKDLGAQVHWPEDQSRKLIGLRTVNAACCTHILLRLVRAGHYFILGFPFFLLLYVFSNRELNNMRIQFLKD